MRKTLVESIAEDFKVLLIKHGIPNPSGLVGSLFARLDSFINEDSYNRTDKHPFDVLSMMLGEIRLVLDGFADTGLPSEVSNSVGSTD